MEQIKIIFFDIDGTLVDPATHRISQKTVEALHRLREKGIKLCIATGRPSASLPPLDGLPFDCFLTFNGSLCYTGQQVISSSPIPPEAVERVIANAQALGRPVSLAVKDRLVANGYDRDLADYYALACLELIPGEDFDLARQQPVYQIMVGCRPCDYEALVAGAQGVKVAVSWDRAVDIIPAASGKGSSIGKILQYYGFTPQEAMAFGDSYNDLEMLKAVGTGVAMGHAPQELKAVATHVCLPVSQEGIYHFCRDKGLI
jgi:Cof subfamily protein (haloacid dehalogenase superfamily)